MPVLHRRLPILLCLCLGQGLADRATAAATPVAAAEDWVASLKAGKTKPAENPAVALSPFCPEEKKQKFAVALEELAASLKTGSAAVEPAVPPRGQFAGCLLVLREKIHPLRTRVLPVCVLNVEGAWKVAAGIEHFQNTRSAGAAGDVALGDAVSKDTIESARKAESGMLAKGAEALWHQIRALRESWPVDGTPEDHVRRYLDFQQSDDTIGRLACFHLPRDLPPASLEKFVNLLADESPAANPPPGGTENPAEPPAGTDATAPQTLVVAKHEIKEQVCVVIGYLESGAPGDSATEPFCLKKGEGGRFLLLPDGYDVEGLHGPRRELTRWYEDNQEDLDKEMVLAFARKGQEMSVAKADKDAGASVVARYLDSFVRRDFTLTLGLLDLPGKDQVESYAGLLSALGDFLDRMVVPEGPTTIVLPMGWHQEGDFGGAVHAVFQPAAKHPFFLDLQIARWSGSAWRVLPPTWEGAPAGFAADPDARKVRQALEDRLDAFKTDAVLSLFPDHMPDGESAASGDEQGARAALATALGHAANGRFKEYLGHWEKPQAGDDPVKALEMATRLAWEIHQGKSPPAIEAVALRGDLAGAVIPIPLGKREDGRKAGRMLVLRRVDGGWRLLPGVEFFRPINRGYKELNAKTFRETGGKFPPPVDSDLKALAAWLETLPPPA